MSVSEAPPQGHGISSQARADQRLFARLHDANDPVTQEMLAERFLPLARSVARAHASNADTYDDVFQVASLALVKAIARFDPDRSVAFSSFAVPTMVGEIKRYFRDRTWTVRPPRGLQETNIRVNRLVEAWTARHGESPTVIDIAEALQIGIEDVLEALQAGGAYRAVSFEAPRGSNGGEDDVTTLADSIGIDETGFDRAEERATLARLLTSVSPREREVLRMRFEEDMTQAEIGAIIGVSQMQVSRVIRQALARLRAAADGGPGSASPT